MKIDRNILVNLKDYSKIILNMATDFSTFFKNTIKGVTGKSLIALSPDDIISGLTEFSELIKNSIDNSAAPFLKLGEELQTVYSDTTALTLKTLKSVEIISGETDNNVLVKIDNIVKHAMSEIENFKSTITVKLEQINEIIEFLEHLNRKCFALERISLFLQVVGLNIGVESTRSSKAIDMFTLVADEIRQLAGKIRALSRDMASDVDVALKTQISAHEQLTKDFYYSMELAHGVKYAVQNAAGDIEKLMSLSLNTLEEAGSNSKAISQQIGEIVMGIQFHDNMAQRIEHIITAIQDVSNLCSKNPTSNKVKPLEERCALAHSILSIQIAQLKQIILEIDTVYRKNSSSFDEIINQTDMIAHSLISIISGGSKKNPSLSASTSKDPFTNLTDILKEIQDLLKKRDKIVEHLTSVGNQASEMVSRLTAHTSDVHKISYEAHMLALNAIVKAAQIGDMGMTLEVLAQEVRILSDQSDVFVKDVDGIIEPVTLVAGKLHDKNSGNKAETSISESIEDISFTYSKFTGDSNEALELSEKVKNEISRIRSELNFLPELATELKKYLENLILLSDNISKLKPTGDISTELTSLSERYTMQEERAIHEQISAGRSLGKNIEPDEQLSEVELFDIGDKPVSVNELPADVELFNADEHEETTEIKKESQESLGDNIELF